MDGVLVDNRDLHMRAFDAWCKTKNISISSGELFALFGMGNREIFPAVMHNANLTTEQIDEYGEQKEAIYRDMAQNEIQPLAGLKNFIDELKSHGIKVAVGSSGMRKNVDMVIKKCGLNALFDAIVNGDMVERAKPAPDIFLLAAKIMGLKPEECFVFEDSFAGIAAARAAGMGVGAVATTFARSEHNDYDILIDDFTTVTYESLSR